MRGPFRVLIVAFVTTLACAGFSALAQETPPAPPAAPPAAAAAPPAPAGPMVNEVKIVVDNKAKSDGEIRFAFAPAGGATKEIRVTIKKGMVKQEICRDMAKELTVGVGPDYNVEQYDDDKVKVERKKDAKFSLTLASQNVSGLSVTLK